MDRESAETLYGLLARERRSERVACRVGADTRRYNYDNFLTTAWQSGNYLRHLGVREGVTVGIVADPVPEALLAALGTGLLGATAWFDPPENADLRAVVAPAGEITRYEARPGRSRVGYGGDIDDPAIERFEEGVWSENPTMPPEAESRSAVDVALVTGAQVFTHGELVAAAGAVGDRLSLTADTEVAVRAPLADPRAFAAGVLAPLYAGGTVVFPDEDTAADAAIVAPDRDAPESTTLGVRDVDL